MSMELVEMMMICDFVADFIKKEKCRNDKFPKRSFAHFLAWCVDCAFYLFKLCYFDTRTMELGKYHSPNQYNP